MKLACGILSIFDAKACNKSCRWQVLCIYAPLDLRYCILYFKIAIHEVVLRAQQSVLPWNHFECSKHRFVQSKHYSV